MDTPVDSTATVSFLRVCKFHTHIHGHPAMVCVQESYLREKVFASSFPRNEPIYHNMLSQSLKAALILFNSCGPGNKWALSFLDSRVCWPSGSDHCTALDTTTYLNSVFRFLVTLSRPYIDKTLLRCFPSITPSLYQYHSSVVLTRQQD
jgi:hypothetical protein